MPDRTAVTDNRPAMVYRCDGTLGGLLCCVYDSYTRRERVVDIQLEEEQTLSLYPTRTVETDEAHARRVYRSLDKNLGEEGMELIRFASRNCDPDRGNQIFRFICLGYRYGRAACGMLSEEPVIMMHKLHRAAWHETHRLLGFVRFEETAPIAQMEKMLPASTAEADPIAALCPIDTASSGGLAADSIGGGGLVAVIAPKHDVLPLMAEHFCDRYPEERFLIYDRIHKLALVYQPHHAELIPMAEFQKQETTAEETLYSRLWKLYYDTIAIESRTNPQCRMSLMPKRFWENMTEMR